MKPDKKKQIYKEIIDKMFEVAGHDLKYEDVEGRTDNWFQQYTMTESQNKEWLEWSTKFLMKKRRWNKYTADREIRMLDLYCGLRITPDKE